MEYSGGSDQPPAENPFTDENHTEGMKELDWLDKVRAAHSAEVSDDNRSIVLRAETGAPCRDADLIALVADARRWMADLLEGRATSVAEITQRENVRPGTVSRILPLAWLAPEIAAAILEGCLP